MRIDGNGKRKAEFIYIPAKCQQTVYITTENFAETRLHVMFFGGVVALLVFGKFIGVAKQFGNLYKSNIC